MEAQKSVSLPPYPEEKGKDVFANMQQYSLQDHYLGLIRFDHSHHDLFVERPLFDAIVTDRE